MARAGASARCSRCRSSVPIARPRRSYLLLGSPDAGPRLAAAAPSEAAALPLDLWASSSADPFDFPASAEPEISPDWAAGETVPEPAAPDAWRAPARSRGLGALLLVALLAAAGVAAGYHGQLRGLLRPIGLHAAVDPLNAMAAGALAGLLLGWLGVRWMARRH